MIALVLGIAFCIGLLTGCAGKTDQTNGNSTQTDVTEAPKNNAAATDTAEEGDEADVNEDGTVNNPESVKVEEGKLVFWSLFSGGDGSFMDQIISDYNNTNPAMGVQSIMLVWADYYTKLQTAVAAGKGPDIGVSHVSKLPELVDQGAVIPIDDYLSELGIDLNTMYSENSIASVTFDGSVYAIPLDTHAEIMYFNKDILNRAGVSLNADGQLDIASADDFKAILDKIKAVLPAGASPLALTNSGDDPYRVWWATYFQMGGTGLVSDDGSTVTLDVDIAVKAAEFVKSLFDEGYILTGIDDHQALFQSGKAGILFGGTWATGAFEKTQGLNFGAQTFPQLFNNESCWADSHTLILPFNKERTEEETLNAVKFIVAAASDGGATWAKSGQIPSNLSVLQSKEYLSLPYRSDYKNALQTAVMPTKNANFYAMKAGMIDSLNAYWIDQVDAATAIDNLKAELESNLN
ncbi:MAG TPA: ABC transporter substrate-binding protein [Lachnospiraceae bacterium]|nr:ABC transporter substrate-binding protein [Lachnospiraceae bacterium]HCA70577.1 ABC transporter substrate-binding protein [Lachnospiraceae bacterium]